MRSTDVVFSKLKSWWIIWCALTVVVSWGYRIVMPDVPLNTCANGEAPGFVGFVATVGHSLIIAGAVLIIWSLARLAAGVRLGLLSLRARDLLLMMVIEAVVYVTMLRAIDMICVPHLS